MQSLKCPICKIPIDGHSVNQKLDCMKKICEFPKGGKLRKMSLRV